MLLTPPSAHQRVVQQNALQKRAESAERREHALAVQLAQEQARALECRRQQLHVAQREREAYLAQARVFFDMTSTGQVQNNNDKPSSVLGRCAVPVGRPSSMRRPPSKSCASSRSAPGKQLLQDKLLASKPQSGWSEVSTAAPSTVGEEDSTDMLPAEPDIASKLSASLRAWLSQPEIESGRRTESKILEDMESSNSLQQLEVALASEINDRDPLDETLSSSEDDGAQELRMPSAARLRRDEVHACPAPFSVKSKAPAQASAPEAAAPTRPGSSVLSGRSASELCAHWSLSRCAGKGGADCADRHAHAHAFRCFVK